MLGLNTVRQFEIAVTKSKSVTMAKVIKKLFHDLRNFKRFQGGRLGLYFIQVSLEGAIIEFHLNKDEI
jgi:hypothetical protein